MNRTEKHLHLHQKQLEVPLVIYIITGTLLWTILVGGIVLLIQNGWAFEEMRAHSILSHFAIYAISGLIFSIVLRLYHYFSYKQLKRKLSRA